MKPKKNYQQEGHSTKQIFEETKESVVEEIIHQNEEVQLQCVY